MLLGSTIESYLQTPEENETLACAIGLAAAGGVPLSWCRHEGLMIWGMPVSPALINELRLQIQMPLKASGKSITTCPSLKANGKSITTCP